MHYKEGAVPVQLKDNLALIFKDKKKVLKSCNYFPSNIGQHSFGLIFFVPTQKAKELFSFFSMLVSYGFVITRPVMDCNLIIAWMLDLPLFLRFLKCDFSFISTNRVLFAGYYFNQNLCHQGFVNILIKESLGCLGILKVLNFCLNQFYRLANAYFPANITCRTS